MTTPCHPAKATRVEMDGASKLVKASCALQCRKFACLDIQLIPFITRLWIPMGQWCYATVCRQDKGLDGMMLKRLLPTPSSGGSWKIGWYKNRHFLWKSRGIVSSSLPNFNIFGSTSNHHETTIRRCFLLLLSSDRALNDLRGHPLRIIEVGLKIAMDVYRKGFLSFHLLKIFSRYSCISA